MARIGLIINIRFTCKLRYQSKHLPFPNPSSLHLLLIQVVLLGSVFYQFFGPETGIPSDNRVILTSLNIKVKLLKESLKAMRHH